MNYFFYSLHTQYVNTGDLLINTSLIELLATRGVVYVDDTNKAAHLINHIFSNDKIIKLSSITNTDNKSVSSFKVMIRYLKKRIKLKKEDDSFYLVLVPGEAGRIGFKSALLYLLSLRRYLLLRLKGVKILRLGVSLQRFENGNGYVEGLFSLFFHAYGVRDTYSYQLGRKLRFFHLSYFPDLAWAYRWRDKTQTLSQKKDYIVLSFRSARSIDKSAKNYTSYILSIISDLQTVIKKSNLSSYKIIISYQVEYDKQAANEIYEFLEEQGFNVELIEEQLDIKNALMLYYNAKCVISNRLHVLLMAILADTLSIPFINIGDNKKIFGVFYDNELSELVLNQKDNNTQNAEQLHGMFIKEKYWLAKYKAVKEKNHNVILDCLDDIIK